MQVCWDGSSHATTNAQLVSFAEFPRAAGVFDEWRRVCPLEYRSDNAPGEQHTSAHAKAGLARLLDELGLRLFARWHGIVGHRSLVKKQAEQSKLFAQQCFMVVLFQFAK